MADFGIQTAYDLAQANPKILRRHINVNIERTIEELNGVPCLGLEEEPPGEETDLLHPLLWRKAHRLTADTAGCYLVRKQGGGEATGSEIARKVDSCVSAYLAP
ncbi:hypothetical protein [Microbulbifer variabilis]|uniref:hypothetical protein n=1 Tax=Microbulbifer variabilis TaxID=266805 RepID=UPI00039FCF13|nr:hypothetical protein [Microbulbifer variabilis]